MSEYEWRQNFPDFCPPFTYKASVSVDAAELPAASVRFLGLVLFIRYIVCLLLQIFLDFGPIGEISF